jgi:hypothetical protein
MKLVNLTKNLPLSRRLARVQNLRAAPRHTGLRPNIHSSLNDMSYQRAGFHSYIRVAFDTIDGFLLNKQVEKNFTLATLCTNFPYLYFAHSLHHLPHL